MCGSRERLFDSDGKQEILSDEKMSGEPKKKKKHVTIMPEEVVHHYKKQEGEQPCCAQKSTAHFILDQYWRSSLTAPLRSTEASFLDPDEPAPHPVGDIVCTDRTVTHALLGALLRDHCAATPNNARACHAGLFVSGDDNFLLLVVNLISVRLLREKLHAYIISGW